MNLPSATISFCFINQQLRGGRTRLLPLLPGRHRSSSSSSSRRMTSFSATNPINWVQSLTTTDVLDDGSARRVSVFSWNVLAQHLFDSTPSWYAHVVASRTWPERCVRILHELSSCEADVICLQEVEVDVFHGDFLPSLRNLGYDGMLQKKKRRNEPGNDYGVATFWKDGRFVLQATEHRSRTMITTLLDSHSINNNNVLAVVNCHLEGNPTKSLTRVKQLQNTLQRLSSERCSHDDLILCGDMNCSLKRSACATYLRQGRLDDEMIEWGRRVTVDDTITVTPHGRSLRSAYPVELAEEEEEDPASDYITYVHGPGHWQVALDQIWYDDGVADSSATTNVRVIGLRHPFHSCANNNTVEEQRRTVLATGLPSEAHPSDHLPVGCILEWTTAATGSSDREREHGLSQKKEATTSPETKAVEAWTLFHACPLEEEDRTELEYVLSPVVGFLPDNKNVKPSSDQLEQLKDRQNRKQALLCKVSTYDNTNTNNASYILEKGFKLWREAERQRRKNM